MYNLKIIIGSTRPGRKGPAVADYIQAIAQKHTEFAVELVDLAEVNLPFLDEPHHPRLQQYQHQHTKDWSAKIAGADAFVIVTPEYNYSFPAPLKNALDFLYNEWNYKPVGFVSYGGLSAGTRAVQMLKQVVTTLKMVPVVEAVNIPFFHKHIDEGGRFVEDERLTQSVDVMLKELARWAESLQAMRNKK